MTDDIEVSDKIFSSGGFTGVGFGDCGDSLVAVRVLWVSPGSDMKNIWNVREFFPLGAAVKPFTIAIL